ncbi:MAG: YkgJ family cysteine cluster protein [Methanosarcinales archaeon]|jgi:Fe-S-cluster containining protein|nr:YkgJ family cysteine cluster protein [Methanosarcinales archaeon]
MKKAESDLEYFEDEKEALAGYSKSHFLEVVQDVGFECDFCGKCCTRAFNDHVYLLKEDISRIFETDADAADAFIPSPYFDFCDQSGRFYVSGYSLKTQGDEVGSCIFLENDRCRIYDNRPLICRVYPYMIHRETDDSGLYDWREISGLNEHGLYGAEISEKEAADIFEMTKKYESGYISQEIEFLRAVSNHFAKNKLKHIPKIYDNRIRDFEKGEVVTVFVYYDGAFHEHEVQK